MKMNEPGRQTSERHFPGSWWSTERDDFGYTHYAAPPEILEIKAERGGSLLGHTAKTDGNVHVNTIRTHTNRIRVLKIMTCYTDRTWTALLFVLL